MDDYHDVAVAVVVRVADGMGALQVDADEVVLEDGFEAGDHLGEGVIEGWELGWHWGIVFGWLVFATWKMGPLIARVATNQEGLVIRDGVEIRRVWGWVQDFG